MATFPKKGNSVNPHSQIPHAAHTHWLGKAKQAGALQFHDYSRAEQSPLALLPLTGWKWFHSKFPEEKKNNPNLAALRPKVKLQKYNEELKRGAEMRAAVPGWQER